MILVYDVPFNSHNIFSVPLTDSKLTQLFIKRYVQFTMFINIDDTAKLADIKSTLCLYRISVVSYPLNHFYILDITYIAMLAKIKIKSCLNRTLISCLHRRHCRYCNACQYQFSSYFFCLINILFTCLTLSKSQCWPTLSRHCVFIVPLHYCLHRHSNQHQVDIVIMTEMESTSPC